MILFINSHGLDGIERIDTDLLFPTDWTDLNGLTRIFYIDWTDFIVKNPNVDAIGI